MREHARDVARRLAVERDVVVLRDADVIDFGAATAELEQLETDVVWRDEVHRRVCELQQSLRRPGKSVSPRKRVGCASARELYLHTTLMVLEVLAANVELLMYLTLM